jgi:hypothetical protein
LLGGLEQSFLNFPFLRVDLLKMNKARQYSLEFLSERSTGNEKPPASFITRISLG